MTKINTPNAAKCCNQAEAEDRAEGEAAQRGWCAGRRL